METQYFFHLIVWNFIFLHQMRIKVHHQRSLGNGGVFQRPTGKRNAVEHLLHDLMIQIVPPVHNKGTHVYLALFGSQIGTFQHKRFVFVVAVENNDFLPAVAGELHHDVFHQINQSSTVQINSSGEERATAAHRQRFITIIDGGRHHRTDLLGQHSGKRSRQHGIHPQRQMRAVLLGGTNRDNQNFVLVDLLFVLKPRQFFN